jgi:rubrerythrin
MNCNKLIIFSLILLLAWPFDLKQAVAGETRKANYFLTISALQQLYNSKIMVSNTYSALAQKALEERNYGLACLFSALSEAGSVHARNFKYILNDLGVDMKDFTKPDIKISNTRENLEFSLAVELSEIDTYYPKLIKRIKPEGNESALKEITYVWKAEMQHRNLMGKMKPFLWSPIGKVVDNLKEAYEYHVCQRCGSTVFQLPEKTCIICGSPVSIYKQIKPQALFDFVGGDTGKSDRSNDLVVARQKGEPFRPKPVPRMHEWFITSFTLNPVIFAKKVHFAYEPTGLEGSILTHYIEQELKLRINPKIPIKVGDTFSELKNKESVDDTFSIIFCISGEIQDLLITSRKSETWGVLKVKYVFEEQRINPSYKSRETKQIQIIPSDNSTDNSTAKTPEAILVQKNLTRDDMEKLLQNAAKEIVNRIVLKLPSVQERTK